MKKIEKAMELLDGIAAIAADSQLSMEYGSEGSRRFAGSKGITLPGAAECDAFMDGIAVGCSAAAAAAEDILNGREADARHAVNCAVSAWIHEMVEEAGHDK